MTDQTWLDVVAGLDPVADCQWIHRVTATEEFPWDHRRALEFALFRTYCVPGISRLLSETGEFRDRPRRRYDDTALLMGELVEYGYDSPRGREALRVVNHQHRRHDIDAEDMLYVLSTFVFEPIDWIDRYGRRPLHPHEREAAFHFYREVGRRMGIRDIPRDARAFRGWCETYEARHFRYVDTNREIAEYTIGILAADFPRVCEPIVRTAVYALVDEPVRRAFGFPRVPVAVGRAAHGALSARGAAAGAVPGRRRPRPVADSVRQTYPDGYALSEVGACPLSTRAGGHR